VELAESVGGVMAVLIVLITLLLIMFGVVEIRAKK